MMTHTPHQLVPGYWPRTLEDLALRLHTGCPTDVLRAYAKALRLLDGSSHSDDAALLLALECQPFVGEFQGLRVTVFGYDTGTSDDLGARPAFTLGTAKRLWSMLTDDPWIKANPERHEVGGVQRFCLSIPGVRWVRV